jgi:hypothetical protein
MRKRQRWKVHQCSVCERWTADGRMYSAGYGNHLLHKFMCTGCRQIHRNERQLLFALAQWELDHDFPKTGELL